MGIYKIGINSIKQIFQKKAPRYLYHFTNEKSAQEIIKNGMIKTSKAMEGNIPSGVFMVDSQNFFTAWGKNKDPWVGLSYRVALFAQALKNGESIFCFKIPTKKLSKKIIIRSQKDLIKLEENVQKARSVDKIFDKVENYKLHQRRGDAIEYVHFGDIPVSESDIVGKVKCPKALKTFLSYNTEIPAEKLETEIFESIKQLFKGKPEGKFFN